MAKTLITHINPHLDDIAAIWLFKKFHPEFKEAKIEFISQSQTDKIAGTETENKIFFGIGKGRFDEHKGNIGDCATSLVWKDAKAEGLIPKDQFEFKAFEVLISWVTLIDTAQMPPGDFDEFGVGVFIRSYGNSSKDSLSTANLGEEILDRILRVLIRKQKALSDFEKRIEINSPFGKGVAVESDYVDQELAYRKGFQLAIIKGQKRRSTSITAPATSTLDLTPVYLKLSQADPKASWFLHHAKKMVLNGVSSAPDVKRTTLSLNQIIEIVRTC